jgi:hypothetical protein
MFGRLLQEPPFLLLGKAAARCLPCSLATKVRWEACDRPQYAMGIFFAVEQAKRLRRPEICLIEFGVGKGGGLLAMQTIAGAHRETGIRVRIYGFDLGTGLPATSDWRDHPDYWKAGDHRMGNDLEHRLGPDTQLIVGDVAETVPAFVREQRAPIGFVAVDLDYYSSTRAALQVFTLPGRQMLPHTPIYCDDTQQFFNHDYAGELLAIHEFNSMSRPVKIDRWRGLKSMTAFPESPWLDAMYMAHET